MQTSLEFYDRFLFLPTDIKQVPGSTDDGGFRAHFIQQIQPELSFLPFKLVVTLILRGDDRFHGYQDQALEPQVFM
jgi:hypothetical protein